MKKLPLYVSAFHSKVFHVPASKSESEYVALCGKHIPVEGTFAITKEAPDAKPLQPLCESCFKEKRRVLGGKK